MVRLGFVGFGCVGFGFWLVLLLVRGYVSVWVVLCLGLGCNALAYVRLGCVNLFWVGLGWVGLCRVGSGRVRLGQVRLG